MLEDIPNYDVEELTLEQAVLLLATEEEKRSTDFTKTSERLLTQLAA